MALLTLSKGAVTIVDDADFAELSRWKWSLSSRGYAVRSAPREGRGKRASRPIILMHRQILNSPLDLHSDHINGDKLDNRRVNLRICTCAENMRNRRPRGLRRYKGVERTRNGKFCAVVHANGGRKRSKRFITEADAAREYDRLAVAVWGEFAWLNFPEKDIEQVA